MTQPRPEPTLPNPNINIKTGEPVGPPPRSSPEIMVSTGIRMSQGGPSLVTVVTAIVVTLIAAPFAAWALYIAAHLPIWAWYASLFPH